MRDRPELKIVVEGTKIETNWESPEFSLIDKMISIECEVIQSSVSVQQVRQEFFQELIDRRICWSDELPNFYRRNCALMLRSGFCQRLPNSGSLPKGWDDPMYEMKLQVLGYDQWDRPPWHDDFRRPWRWKQLKRELIRISKILKKEYENTGIVPSPAPCCKKKNVKDKT